MYRLDNEQSRIVAQVAAVAEQSIAPHAQRVDQDRASRRSRLPLWGRRDCWA
jgi:type VI protein secretion system component VasF